MKNNYVLIDYENVQPKNLQLLKGHDFIIKIFVGANQSKIPVELAAELQAFGEKAEYIQISGNGPNALDFHIAYYMGKIAAARNEQEGASIAVDSLPELSTVGDGAYDGVLCSGVLMHLPEEELFDSIFTLRRILKEKGRALISIPHPDSTIDPATQRDGKGRLFSGITPGQLELLFERVGFRLLYRSTASDGLGRRHSTWGNLLFEKND